MNTNHDLSQQYIFPSLMIYIFTISPILILCSRYCALHYACHNSSSTTTFSFYNSSDSNWKYNKRNDFQNCIYSTYNNIHNDMQSWTNQWIHNLSSLNSIGTLRGKKATLLRVTSSCLWTRSTYLPSFGRARSCGISKFRA